VSGSRYYVRSAFALAVAQMFTWAASAVLIVMVPRYLGDVELGKFAFASAIVALAGLAADLGTGTYLMKEIARDRSLAPSLFSGAVTLRVPLSLAAAGAVVAMVHFGDYDPVTRQITDILAWNIVLGTVSTLALSLLQGTQNMAAFAALPVVGKVLNTALGLAALLSGGGAVGLAQASVAGAALGAIATVVVLARVVKIRPQVTLDGWRGLLFGGLPFFAWQASQLVYGEIDKVLLGFMATDAVVGWYAAAYRIISIPIFVPGIVMTIVFPALAAVVADEASFRSIVRRSLDIVIVATVPMAIGIMLLADRVIDFLGYPSTFEGSVLPIALLAPTIALTGVGMILGTALQARGLQRPWAVAGVAAAVLNPALNVAAIPWTQNAYGNGGIGAAAATLITEVVMLAVAFRLMPSGMFGGANVRTALKTGLACVTMGLAVWAARDWFMLIPVVFGAIVYAASSMALGTISFNDLKRTYAELGISRLREKHVPA
jgi:O-antigen/teichoic acid export membrane protein